MFLMYVSIATMEIWNIIIMERTYQKPIFSINDSNAINHCRFNDDNFIYYVISIDTNVVTVLNKRNVPVI